MNQVKNVHLIGIGGIGVSAAARYFKSKHADVSGSDMHPSAIVDQLEKEGIQVKIGHFADNIPRGCDLVIYSQAVPATNVERQASLERGIHILSYAEFLGELAKEYKTIAISGTNGKSTTTAMTAQILIDAGLDPTVILGTKVPGWEGKNFRKGESDLLVIEACEHMANMLHIVPDIAVITNIEEDHLDFYKDIEHIRDTFQKWADAAGTVLVNEDDPESRKIKAKTLVKFKRDDVKDVTLTIPGDFNVMNAAAAADVARMVGAKEDSVKLALEAFSGTWRRFEHVGTWKDTDVYSDYAHHPSAIKGALAAYRDFFSTRRLLVCFEPHQYSRTAELFDDFVTSFEFADVLILSAVYEVAGRNEFAGKTSKDLAQAINKLGKPKKVYYAEDLEKAEAQIRDHVLAGDVIIIMGAGDVDKIARKLVS